MKNPTHVHFDGKKIQISSNLEGIFVFLADIEKEICYVLKRNKQIEEIHKNQNEILDLMKAMSDVIKENKIHFEYKLKGPISRFADPFINNQLIVRSEFIVLFGYMESLRGLWTSYELNTSDQQKLRDASDESIDKFIKKFMLNPKNPWVEKNQRLNAQLSPAKIRKLRNNLTHFFTIPNKMILVSKHDEVSNLILQESNYTCPCLSSKDLLEMLEGATIQLISLWSNDRGKKDNYEDRLKNVSELVKSHGVVIVSKNPNAKFPENKPKK
jgi:hypothetical protein